MTNRLPCIHLSQPDHISLHSPVHPHPRYIFSHNLIRNTPPPRHNSTFVHIPLLQYSRLFFGIAMPFHIYLTVHWILCTREFTQLLDCSTSTPILVVPILFIDFRVVPHFSVIQLLPFLFIGSILVETDTDAEFEFWIM